jgi:CelD/BcsL family acetyltransferase involved in cellulose biosynthesis
MRASLDGEKHFPVPPSVFVTPAWLETWWGSFGGSASPMLLSVKKNGRTTGLAPLLVRGETASFIGCPEVCDYLDFCVIPGEEQNFSAAVLQYLFQSGISKLELHALRPDSAALAGLSGSAQSLPGVELTCVQEAVSVELKLPGSWEQYLAMLDKKQRHEVRRKLRRLKEAGPYCYRVIEGEAAVDFTPHFLEMFKQNPEKEGFLSGTMSRFFPLAIKAAIQSGLARFGVLEFAERPAAAVLYFDYRGAVYLYNSAYEPEFAPLSAGLLCKALNLKDAIERGRLRYDFLKGGEAYKYRLGGLDIPIFQCSAIRTGQPLY